MSVLAGYLPARRPARMDPLPALRAEEASNGSESHSDRSASQGSTRVADRAGK